MSLNTSNTFANKVRNGQKVIIYELVPPPKTKPQSDIQKSIALVTSQLTKLSVDAINIPEVLEEKRHGERNAKIIEKLDPVSVSKYIYDAGFTDIIINRPIVYLSWEEQKVWLKNAYDKSLHNFIFVGGESSSIQYPGASVTQAAKTTTGSLQNEFPDILIGGITIPTRSKEADRLLHKSQAGIEFFTTQIIYESESIKQLLKEYWQASLENKIKPKMICLSFASVTTRQDIELLTWLGVKIPQATIEELTTGWLGMGWRSLKICQTILEEVFQFTKEHSIQIPLGLNIGYLNRHNFEFSSTFLKDLSDIYLQNHQSNDTMH